MDQLQELLAQPTLWGLTIGQTALVLVIAAGLVILWTVLGYLLRLAGTILQVGCALILLLSCGCATTMVLYNLANRLPR